MMSILILISHKFRMNFWLTVEIICSGSKTVRLATENILRERLVESVVQNEIIIIPVCSVLGWFL